MGLLDRAETTAGLLAGQPVHMLGRRALERDTAALRRPGMNLVPNAIKFARENPIEAAVTGVSMSGAEPFATAADVVLAAYDAGRAAWDGRWGDAAMAGGTGAAAIAIPFVGYGGLRSFAGNGATTAEMSMLSSEEDLEQAETEDVPREMPNGVMDSDAFYRLGQNALNRDTAALRRPGMNLVPNAIEFARENPVEAGLLGASMALPWPVGDAVGFAGDVMGMVNRPEDRTWGNAALATAGLLPFVPHMALTFAGKGAKTADMAMLRRAEDLEQAGTEDVPRDQQIVTRAPGVMASTGDLPMDTASRMARADEMGYSPGTIYRGAQQYPNEYPGGGHFSRDREYSARFDPRKEPQEFRLKLVRGVQDRAPLTGRDYADLINAAAAEGGTEVALRVAGALAQDISLAAPKNAKQMQQLVAMLSGQAADAPLQDGGLVRQLINKAAGDEVAIFKSAGFDHFDSGRDIRKLDAEGIRSKDAAFDPSNARSRNVFATMAPVAGVGLGAGLLYPASEKDGR